MTYALVCPSISRRQLSHHSAARFATTAESRATVILLDGGDRPAHAVLIAQPLVDRRLGYSGRQHQGDVLAVLVELRSGHLPQPGVRQMREPPFDQRRPVRLAHRWRPTGTNPVSIAGST